ncbi:MAG: LacI family DNA-binding transcriptional regulator [Vallitaleaceae bacterium]|nr:LacI family DNA-binding transcriptional regulator [Vallitaleaceae bacterium]
MVKIKDIAKATGYSITTVSKAFNGYTDISEEARRAVLETAERLGYIPNGNARSLATKKSNTIGIIFDEITGVGFRHPFFAVVIEHFKNAVEKEGYDILFISSSIGGKTNVKSYLEHCLQRGVDGVFIAATQFEAECIHGLVSSDIPCVSVEIFTDQISCINSNDYQGSYDATKYMHDLGHRKIAHIAGADVTYAGHERKRGYLSALQDLEIPLSNQYIVDGGYFAWKNGYNAMAELVKLKDRPTGIVVAGDMMALGAVKCIYDMGMTVPDDFSIIGFDNIEILQYSIPGITTVAQDFENIGIKSAELLISSMINPSFPKQCIYLPTNIVERDSCKKIDL